MGKICCCGLCPCHDSQPDPDNPRSLSQEENMEHSLDDILEELLKYITDLLKQLAKKSGETSRPRLRCWPSLEGFDPLKEFFSQGAEVVKTMYLEAEEVARALLQGIPIANLALAGFLVVASILERLEQDAENLEDCVDNLEEMIKLAQNLKSIRKNLSLAEKMKGSIRKAAELIVEGSMMCGTQIKSRINSYRFTRLFRTEVEKKELLKFKERLKSTNDSLMLEILTCSISKKPVLSRLYPEEAVGIKDSENTVRDLLRWESPEKAIAVILHGPEGIGKSILADAVFSQINAKGLKYSKVDLSDLVTSTPKEIKKKQTTILRDLTESPEQIRAITTVDDGKRELLDILKAVSAFIYIDNADNVCPDVICKLLPENMKKTKKVRLLVTARDQKVCTYCKQCRITTIGHPMDRLSNEHAMELLKNDLDDLFEPEVCNESQTDDKDRINSSQQLTPVHLDDLVNRCCGIPKRLKDAAKTIRGEDNVHEGYRKAVRNLETELSKREK